jgi:hypothetical protein
MLEFAMQTGMVSPIIMIIVQLISIPGKKIPMETVMEMCVTIVRQFQMLPTSELV